jgi:hypothetical protein
VIQVEALTEVGGGPLPLAQHHESVWVIRRPIHLYSLHRRQVCGTAQGWWWRVGHPSQ